jgi:protein gp37
MSVRSAIEWTEATWNPWMGCTKVSPGCDHCYMFTEQRRYGNDPEVVRRSKTKFADPLKWKEPKLIFTCSWSDWLHKDADAWRPEAWEIIKATPHHTYQILTKRPGRIPRRLPPGWPNGYEHVWLGVSVENQRAAYRARQLVEIKRRYGAGVLFISAEPLLGPVDFRGKESAPDSPLAEIDWLIAGGESGPDFRPSLDEWALSLRDQCREYGTAFFYKQKGGFPDKRGGEKALLDGRRYTEMPANYALAPRPFGP